MLVHPTSKQKHSFPRHVALYFQLIQQVGSDLPVLRGMNQVQSNFIRIRTDVQHSLEYLDIFGGGKAHALIFEGRQHSCPLAVAGEQAPCVGNCAADAG